MNNGGMFYRDGMIGVVGKAGIPKDGVDLVEVEPGLYKVQGIERRDKPLSLSELRKALERNNWISVKDRLPVAGREVLLTDGTRRRCGKYDNILWMFWVTGGPAFLGVTHWMELPEAPE